MDQNTRRNPYPVYAELRRNRPVCQVKGGIWVAARHADVMRIAKDVTSFSSSGFRVILSPPTIGPNPVAESILALDPPNHTQLRALVSRAFTPRNIGRLEGRVTDIANEIGDRLRDMGEADLVAELAGPLPARIIAEILGLDPALHREFKRWGEHLAVITPATVDPLASAIRSSIGEMERYFKEVIAARRRNPREDIVTDLTRAEVDGVKLSDPQIISFLFLLLSGGFETTVNLIAHAMMILSARPQDHDRLRAEPHMIPAFVEEVLRYEPPLQGLPRVCSADVVIGGQFIPAGSLVVGLIGSANRDESLYHDPDQFDMDREQHGALAFGHGIHFCLGAALARLEGRLSLEALLSRFRRLQQLPGEITYTCAISLRGPIAVPMRFIPG
ncbi:cytochrome P450 [Chondromyces crocatus]|nr:cytochrome P450 [Chondromyces crocatus]